VRQGYSEPVNLFAVIAMPPGSRKSPVFEAVMHPIQSYEESLMREMAEEIARAEVRYNIAKTELQQLQAKAAKEPAGVERMRLDDEAATLAVKLLSLLPPEKPRFVTDDTTPEKLGSLLAANSGRIAVLSAEGGDVFAAMSGRYTTHQGKQGGQMGHFAAYLKGYSGDTLHVDRVGRPSEYVKQPALTVGLTVQPSVLHGLQRHQEFRERGLLGRFLYALPPVLLGHRQTRTPPVPTVVSATYHARLTGLLAVPLEIDEGGYPVARALQMTPEASELFEDFESRVEPMLSRFGLLGHMTDWGGKLVGNVARIVGLLHCASTPQAPWLSRITPDTVRRALCFGEYLISHARAAYSAMGADVGVEHAKHLLAWLKREERTVISKRDLHQGTRTRFPRIGMMEPALQLLVEHGFLVPQTPATQDGKPGRPAGPCYDINPHLYTLNSSTQNTQNTQKGEPGGGFEDFEYFERQKTTLNGTHHAVMDDGKQIAGDVDEVVL
jgi:hypothetical protein